MSAASPRRIWLCADDYGISASVNRGIRELIARRRLNATSVMVVGPAIGADEVSALQAAADSHCAVGLHAVLTAPFHPLTMHFKPLADGRFLPLPKLLRASLSRRLDREIIGAELGAQIARFIALFGRAPDYLDGHQHVQLFPQVRDAFLDAARSGAPGAWVRQCGRAQPFRHGLSAPKTQLKALLLDALSRQFRRKATRAGVAFNPGFAGAYDFSQGGEFGALMRGFLDGLPDGGLIMCHPGFVDDTLRELDPLTDQREREYAYLAGDGFPALLAATATELR
ncbi:MAG: ChbG/HpnK family deacetylase [Xanthobacteraceae bacterium]|nr:ChbG/HpnK family deacetylase [Xanthobacteraceae bacterium]